MNAKDNYEVLLKKSVSEQGGLMISTLLSRTHKYPPVAEDRHWIGVPEYLSRLRDHLSEETKEFSDEVDIMMREMIAGRIPDEHLMSKINAESADVCNLAMMVRERCWKARDEMIATTGKEGKHGS